MKSTAFFRILLPALLVLLFNSCFIGRTAADGTTLRIENKTQVTTFITADSYYWPGQSENDCMSRMVEACRQELATYNVKVVDSGDADYVLTITNMKLSESTSTETVNDPNSEYNGKTFELVSVESDVDGSLEKTSNKNSRTVSGFGAKQEKLKNNRSLAELVTGQNKDHTCYRMKSLPSDVYTSMAEKSGRHLAYMVTRQFKKM